MILLNNQGFEARHICAVSSHKNKATIRNYAVHCLDTKKREMSESLAKALVPEMIQKTMDKPEIPEDPMLEEINWDDDKMLVKVLEKIKKENQSIAPLNATAPTPEITSQNAVVLQPGPSAPNIVSNVAAGAKLPIMYFPHSNVTINYHIHQ